MLFRSNLPIALLGGGAGAKGGRHLKYAEDTPLANLVVTIMDRLGVQLDTLGNSTGKVQFESLTL